MAENEVTGLERQIADFKKQLDESRGQVLDQSGKNVEQKILSDQVAADREMYQTIVKRLNQAEVTGNFKDIVALSLSDIATVPDKSVKPNKPVAAVASLLVFGMLFLGLPITWGFVDDHLLKLVRQGGSPSVVIPSIKHAPTRPLGAAPASFPQVPLPQAPAQAQIPAPVASPAAAPAASPFMAAQAPAPAPVSPSPLMMQTANQAPVLAKLPLVGQGTPEAMIGQLLQPEPYGAAGALSQLTTTLEVQALKRSGLGGVILLTSADAGEGKTLAAAALAAAFCHQGRRVFMMECNAVAPSLHQWFPHSARHSSWAHDLESLRYCRTNLFILPAHDLPAYATNELLDGYRSWIERAKQQVDWVILDGGPILKNFADVAPLAPLATDVILVNNPAISNPAKLRAAMNLLQPMMSSSAFRGMIVHGAA
jgi:Mrp family chromosome partitioning ATPase